MKNSFSTFQADAQPVLSAIGYFQRPLNHRLFRRTCVPEGVSSAELVTATPFALRGVDTGKFSDVISSPAENARALNKVAKFGENIPESRS